MARIRTIKPEFWQDEDLATVSSDALLLAIGLLNQSDDEGYFKAHPALLKAAIFPFREDYGMTTVLLPELSKLGYLSLFNGSDGKSYGQVINFAKHQVINKPRPSKIRALCLFSEESGSTTVALPHGREGKGKEYIEPKKTNNFKPPTIEQVQTHLDLKGYGFIDAENFVSHYQANGWMRGKSKIKCWKSCVTTWAKNNKSPESDSTEMIY